MPSNSANPGLGTLQKPLLLGDINLTKIACDCAQAKTYDQVSKKPVPDYVKCMILGSIRHGCVDKKIKDAKDAAPSANADVHSGAGHKFGSLDLPLGKKFCRPDIVIGQGTMPLDPRAMKKIYELKFPCNKGKSLPSETQWSAKRVMSASQRECYKHITPLGGGPAKKNGVKVIPVGPTKETCE